VCLYFSVNVVGYTLSCTVLLLWLGIVVCFMHACNIVFISGSVLMSIICFNTRNSLVFWASYEVSILLLLMILYLDSPYSERPLACWYLVGYLCFTRLPLLLCILYLSSFEGSLGIFAMSRGGLGVDKLVCLLVMSVCFIVKVPLYPFHSWLPAVHAEAPRVISVCLSGYVMKLGIYGLYRFCSPVVSGVIFSSHYVFVLVLFGVIFMLFAQGELDGKRWLAYLSLSHMVCSALGMYLVGYHGYTYPVYKCLGHGLRSSASFILL